MFCHNYERLIIINSFPRFTIINREVFMVYLYRVFIRRFVFSVKIKSEYPKSPKRFVFKRCVILLNVKYLIKKSCVIHINVLIFKYYYQNNNDKRSNTANKY